MSPVAASPPRRRDRLAWGLAGLGLGAPLAAAAVLSPRLAAGGDAAGQPVAWAVACLIAAGAAYLAGALTLGRRRRPGGAALAWMLAVGMALRLVMFWSTPILEDDHYRYLWDGALAAAGQNPYALSPAQVLAGGPDVPPGVTVLARRAGSLLERVNHPELTTIYPPLTQAALGLAALLRPFGLWAWRTVLLGADCLSLCLLWRLLARWGLPLGGLLVYWWNPVLIKEAYNSAHMEPLLFPFLLGALGLAAAGRGLGASGLLGLAAGVKLWPLVLWPAVARPAWGHWGRLALWGLAAACAAAAACAPLFLARLDGGAGLVAYAGRWEMNDALYLLLFRGARALTGGWREPHLLARLAAAGLIAAWALWQARLGWADGPGLARRTLWITAGLFMLGPTQFPWYYLWMLPMLALWPSPGLLVLSATLPLYYLRFWLAAEGRADLFDDWLVWLEYLPAWALLAWEARSARGPDRKGPAAA